MGLELRNWIRSSLSPGFWELEGAQVVEDGCSRQGEKWSSREDLDI